MPQNKVPKLQIVLEILSLYVQAYRVANEVQFELMNVSTDVWYSGKYIYNDLSPAIYCLSSRFGRILDTLFVGDMIGCLRRNRQWNLHRVTLVAFKNRAGNCIFLFLSPVLCSFLLKATIFSLKHKICFSVSNACTTSKASYNAVVLMIFGLRDARIVLLHG